jgi:hypothetical protein
MSIDPTKIQIQATRNPLLDNDQSFQELMGDQLKHAPWLFLSILIHLVAIAIIWLIPAERVIQPDKKIEMAKVKEETPPEEEPPPPPEPEKEEVKEEVVLQDNEVVEVTETVTEEFSDVTDTKESAFDSTAWNSAVGLGGGAGGKTGGRRGGRGSLGARGGRATAQAIEAGLEWLKNHQDEDGKWDSDGFMKHDTQGTPCTGPGNPVHDVGLTGLALLAFLGDGSTLRAGPYKDVVKKAVNWLRLQQDPNTGLFGTASSHDFIYNHMIAAYAMVEAYGLSDYLLLKPIAQKGINYLEAHRNPYKVWRYQPRDNDNDSSVTGWGVMVYKSGQDFKLDVSTQALKMIEAWFDEVTDPLTGRAGYSKRGEPSSRHVGDHMTRFPVEKGEALTAVGLMSRFFLGQDPKQVQVMRAAADTMLKRPPVWNDKDGSLDFYYWYYATYALYQFGGTHWSTWEKALTSAVVKNQRTDGNFKGSWDPIDAWGEDGGRVYATALNVLTLEAYYRYSKLIR